MNTIIVERWTTDALPTLSRVFVQGNLLGFGLEDRHRTEKVAGDTRIPAGRYDLRWRTAGRWAERYARKGYQGSLEVVGVPNFSAVLIHVGNTKRDTAGCLLIGKGCDLTTRTITKSAIAVGQLYAAVKNIGGDWAIEFSDPT